MDTERKSHFDALMRLAEFRNARIKDRRSHEWKVTLAVWGLLAAGIAKPPKIEGGLCLIGLGLAVVVIAHAFGWVGSHWQKSEYDGRVSFYYTDQAHKLATGQDHSEGIRDWPKEKSLGETLCNPRCLAQITATAVLALGAFLAIRQGLTH
jgi:hypothetical protein